MASLNIKTASMQRYGMTVFKSKGLPIDFSRERERQRKSWFKLVFLAFTRARQLKTFRLTWVLTDRHFLRVGQISPRCKVPKRILEHPGEEEEKRPLQTVMYMPSTEKLAHSVASLILSPSNRSLIDLGIIPALGSFSHDPRISPRPSMVYVLPVPVWP